jgi:tetratricopeptide (TPR) repeat protein
MNQDVTDWWQSAFQTTIDAYYRGDLVEGLAACERLLSINGLPEEFENQIHRNLSFYTPRLRELAPGMREQPVQIPVREGWSQFNPSIAADDDGFRMVVRSSNYQYQGSFTAVTVVDPDEIFRTENFLLFLDHDLNVRQIQTIDDAAFRPEPPPFPVSGFEDLRLFQNSGSWWATATVRDWEPFGTCRVVLLRLEGALLAEVRLLSDGTQHEKNWMPVPPAAGEPLRFLYSSFPTVVLTYADASGAVVPELTQPAPLIARRFRGGRQLVPVEGGHLGLVHEAAWFEDQQRLYFHRWVWFDSEWRLARLSPPFRFQVQGVEFAAGLARRGDELIVSYGVWDRDAWLARVPLTEVLSLLAAPLNPEQTETEMRAEAALFTAPAHAKFAAELPDALESGQIPPQEIALALEDSITPFPLQDPVIVSTTISGNSREIIGDALRSVVEWVDWCLVINTGITDDTLDIAREIVGDKLIVRQLTWRDDFSEARNFALDAAAEIGATWAVTLDTDERLDVRGVDVRAALRATTVDMLQIKHVNGTYSKEKVFRLPARGRYVGPTHEAFIQQGMHGELEGVRFDEQGKTAEQYQHKAERDVAILTRHTAENPEDPRWFYYLGDSLAGLGRYDEAVAAFRDCASLGGWDEEGAWAMYRAAECLITLDRPDDAVAACTAGMARHGGLAELQWLAGFAAWRAGRPDQASYWARQAIAMGHFHGVGGTVPRHGFRYPPALWELPYDLLRFALRALGDDQGAAEAEQLYELARAAREAAENSA